ncbi:MAG: hypothetical protein ACJ73J_12385 [Actinomycetes bacterium]
MSRFTAWVAKAWTRVRIAHYRRQQEELAESQHEAAERLEQLKNGGDPYGPRTPGGGMWGG